MFFSKIKDKTQRALDKLNLPKTRDMPSDGHLSFLADEDEETATPNLEALSNSLAEARSWLETNGANDVVEQMQDGVAGFQSLIGGLFGGDTDQSDAGLEKMFNSMDEDRSGTLSETEMKAAINKVYGQSGLVVDESAFRTMMRAADTNNDGEVDLEEFKAMMRAGPEAPNPVDAIAKNEQLQDVLDSARALIAQAEAQQQQLLEDFGSSVEAVGEAVGSSAAAVGEAVGSSVDEFKSAAVAATAPKIVNPRTIVGAVGVEYKSLLPYVNSNCVCPLLPPHASSRPPSRHLPPSLSPSLPPPPSPPPSPTLPLTHSPTHPLTHSPTPHPYPLLSHCMQRTSPSRCCCAPSRRRPCTRRSSARS